MTVYIDKQADEIQTIDFWQQFWVMNWVDFESVHWNEFTTSKMKLLIFVCVSGGEGLAEVRDGAAAEEVCGAHPSAVPRGLEE